LTLFGTAAESLGMDRHLKVNTKHEPIRCFGRAACIMNSSQTCRTHSGQISAPLGGSCLICVCLRCENRRAQTRCPKHHSCERSTARISTTEEPNDQSIDLAA
jgi:hypothetical protein